MLFSVLVLHAYMYILPFKVSCQLGEPRVPDVFPDGVLAVVYCVCKVCKLPVSLLILASLEVEGCHLGLSGSCL